MLSHLFVYGTLMSRVGVSMSVRLSREAVCLGPASTNGRLYDFGKWPGMIVSNEQGDLVHGELYWLASPALSLAWLDAYEGIGLDGQNPEYARVVCKVRLESGPQFDAWVYEYRWPIANGFPLRNGRWHPSNSQRLAPVIFFQPSAGPAMSSELGRQAQTTESTHALSGT
jgi:gamma-glutamylcyclotransferase (GGCT)/AIG2-like uncharacterized protein YtfP